jgi:hypothetical protein
MNRRGQQEAEARWARAVLDADAAGERPESGAESWQAAWQGLELPPAAGGAAPLVPPDFARRVALAWRAEQARAAAPLLGAGWMRAAALAALLAGIALGSTLSLAGSNPADSGAAAEESWQTTSLSEEYLSALASPEAILSSPTGADEAADVESEAPAAEP